MKILEEYRPPKPEAEGAAGLISVIIAAYNIEGFIERGVRSVCAQTYQNLEVILVDDGSTDKTGVICDALAAEDRRILVIHKENGGLAQARNVGTARARGSYIGYVDGDDWVDPDMYEKLLGALLDQQTDMAVCRYRQISCRMEPCDDGNLLAGDGRGEDVWRHIKQDDGENQLGAQVLNRCRETVTCVLDESVDRAVLFEGQEALEAYVEEREEYAIQNAAWNKLYRREILAGLSFPEGKWYEDILFATKALARARRLIYLDSALYNYIIDREGSIMNQRVTPRTFTDLIPAWCEKTAFLRGIGREDLALTHDFFLYKRLLLFYFDLEKEKDPAAYQPQLEELLQRDRASAKRAFAAPAASRRDKKCLTLFYRSPKAYCRRMFFEERVVIPLKAWGKRMLLISRK